jgi:hypothetical protein
MGLRQLVIQVVCIWCPKPVPETDLATFRHHALSPHQSGSTRRNIFP